MRFLVAWSRFWLWYGLAAAGGALLVSGCSTASLPPATPSPTEIGALRSAVSAIDAPAKEYFTYGTALAAKNCVGWFGGQMARASQSSALAGELGLLGTAAGVAGGPAGAAAGAALGFGAATLGNIQANSPAGLDPVVTYGLVRKVQQAWLAAVANPTTKAEAYMLVEDFAERCQLADIRKAVADAVTTAPVQALPVSGAATFGLAPEPGRPAMPPIIVIGPQAQDINQPRGSAGEGERRPARRDGSERRSTPLGSRQRSIAGPATGGNSPDLRDDALRMEWLRETSMFIPAIDKRRR